MHPKPEKALGAPRGSSTPSGRMKVTGRPGIRDYETKEDIVSPINKKRTPGDESQSDDDAEYCTCSTEDRSKSKSPHSSNLPYVPESIGCCTICGYQRRPTPHGNGYVKGVMLCIAITAVLAGLLYNYDNEQESCSLKDISKDSLIRTKDFWLSIETALNDIVQFNKPKTIIFLYEPEHSAHLDDLLASLSDEVKCWISHDSPPIRLGPSDLNSKDIVDDYGKVITLYQERLKDSGVMIVQNLDKVSGMVAQAFHSFCDEYNPLVERALFLFTVEVAASPGNKLKYLEERLRGKWGDLPEEKFYPLFTRITDLVLEIKEGN